MTYTIVQLGRYGDIISLLPLAQRFLAGGHTVRWVVHQRHADILDAEPRIERVLWTGADTDVAGAAALGTGDILIPQVSGGRPHPDPRDGYQLEQWDRAGYLRLFDTLPLWLNHPPALHAALLDEVQQFLRPRLSRLGVFDGGFVVGNFAGHSSPYPLGELFSEQLRDRVHELGCDYLDISNVRFSHPLALAHLLQLARSCVTIDTLTAHLSFATKTPTYVLQPDNWYYCSTPRSHWLGRCYHFEALERLPEIARAAVRVDTRGDLLQQPDRCRRIVHAYNHHETTDPATTRRNSMAEQTWERLREMLHDQFWQTVRHDTGRSSKEDLGDPRGLPRLHDLIEFACAHADTHDIVVLTNHDTCLVPETPCILRRQLETAPCAWSARCDVLPAPPCLHAHDIEANHPGADLFAFTPEWWASQRHQIPLLYLGAEGWDWVFKNAMRLSGGRPTRCVVYHETHRQTWVQPGTLETSPANRHNRRAMRQWAERHGIDWRGRLPHPELFTL